jgi:hypothetical protein
MRIFADDGFQFCVAPPQPVIVSACLPQLCFESGELPLEVVDLLGLALDSPLLLLWFRWAIESQSAEDLFEETHNGRRATQVRLVDLVGGRHQRHSGTGIKRGAGL